MLQDVTLFCLGEVAVKKVIALWLVCSLMLGCSTAGGIYKEGDQKHGEFSGGRTFLTILGIAAAAAAARHGGGGGSYADQGFAWDYQPGNRQWACRNKANGQYAYAYQCAGVPQVDYWP